MAPKLTVTACVTTAGGAGSHVMIASVQTTTWLNGTTQILTLEAQNNDINVGNPLLLTLKILM